MSEQSHRSPVRGLVSTLTAKVTDIPRQFLDRERSELDEIRRTGRGGRVHSVTTADGATLHAEIDGSPQSSVTVIFCHGYTLNLTSWREQRGPIAGPSVQRVFYDQRGFGMSEDARSEPATIDHLARDLYDVIDDVAPSGPVILVGHSMGSMVIQALAGIHPELFGSRVVTAVLIATAARGRDITIGLPSGLVRQVMKVAPGVLKLIGSRPEVVRAVGLAPYLEIARLFHARSAEHDTKRIFAAMVSANSMDALATYLTPVVTYDGTETLSALSAARVIVVAGQKDMTTTVALNRDVAESIPGAELVVVPDCGHMVPLEKPDTLNTLLLDTVSAATSSARNGEGA